MATDNAADSAADSAQSAETYVTVQQAAVRLGIAERTVYARVAAGRLRARQNGRRMLVQISHADAAGDAESQMLAMQQLHTVHAVHAVHAEERRAWDDERRRLLAVIETLTAEVTAQRTRARRPWWRWW